MAGFFEELLKAGVEHALHVSAVREAMSQPDEERATTVLTSYLRSLSTDSFRGFEACVAGLAANEANQAVRQNLEWIHEHAAEHRSGPTEVTARPPDQPLRETDTERPEAPPSRSRAGASSRAPEGGSPGDLSGTWQGRITDDDGAESDAVFELSESGHWVYGCEDQRGNFRRVEVKDPGQRIQYVPPGGGVVTIDFDEVSVSLGGGSYAARYSDEGFRNGVLDQESRRILFQYELRGGGLGVEYASAGQKHSSASGLMVGGQRGFHAKGTLRRKDTR